jgi:hypothetical protein
MRQRKTSENMIATPRQLDKLIEEATVDCYNDEEQASGFFTMIDEGLALPFRTEVLGIEVSVIAIEMENDGGLKAVCEHAAAFIPTRKSRRWPTTLRVGLAVQCPSSRQRT